MINIRVRAINHKIESSYEKKDFVTLNDFAICVLELERIKQRLIDESDNCENDLLIKSGDECDE